LSSPFGPNAAASIRAATASKGRGLQIIKEVLEDAIVSCRNRLILIIPSAGYPIHAHAELFHRQRHKPRVFGSNGLARAER
jgi:hypothetical protein